DPYEMEYERAVELIKKKREAAANNVIKDFGEDAKVLKGRYGPYIKIHGANVKIPKGVEPEDLTLEECERLYEENKNKPKRRGKGKK
ncbi:MAG: DNA topoisomerase I, partial [Bacteroidetes bacterium]|nr:DNA topoisomerase I [Bacteroidota bacterium]